ncbi:fibrous sheath CABYR-binding protein-like [Anopheles nili]|uniref:fibrous sheath CABYR-binding protein-like n=1 Tax=Anopheles nili TaxID=185578 RepID=UPI00237C4F2A|nr:fibrous sheath CABYR-binding protein-like [Anopheles nili]
MKLTLVVIVAVLIATCCALPVPKEEVFAVYPVNSALAQHSSDLPVEAKPEQATGPVAASAAKDLTVEKETPKPEVGSGLGAESTQEQTKAAPEKLEETVKDDGVKAAPEVVATPVKEETARTVEEAKSAPLKDATEVKAEPTPAAVAESAVDVPTTASSEDARREVSQSVPVEPEPKMVVPETKAATEVKEVTESKSSEEKETAPVAKAVVEDVKASVDEKAKELAVPTSEGSVVEKSAEVTTTVAEQVATVAPTESKSEKLTEETKVEATSEARAAPVVEANTDSKPAEKVAQEPVVKAVPETVEAKPTSVEMTTVNAEPASEAKAAASDDVKPTLLTANDPEPKTEGKDEVKPTKVRAAPIVEGLTVSQPVEAEPAVAKIQVTVVQEAEKETVQDAPVTEAEEKTSGPATTTVPEVKKLDEEVEQKLPESPKAEADVLSMESSVKSEVEPEKAERTFIPATAPSSEAVVVVVPSVKPEDVTTVVAVAENTDKPAGESAEDKPMVRSVAASDELLEATTTTAKVEESKDGSSQPGATETSDAVQEDTKDQSDGNGTTVSSVTEQDTTTVAAVTEPEPVPTPAKQKAKKQVPPNLKGYSKRLKLQEAQRKQGDSE